ncbi:hypothetical protein TrRE_jg8502, partial [Triparma retinervis]
SMSGDFKGAVKVLKDMLMWKEKGGIKFDGMAWKVANYKFMRLAIAYLLASSAVYAIPGASSAFISSSPWSIVLNEDHSLTATEGSVVISSICSELNVKTADGAVQDVNSCDLKGFQEEPTLEISQGGDAVVVTHHGMEGMPTLEQRFEQNEEGGFVVSLKVTAGGGGDWSTNYIAPIAGAEMVTKGGEDVDGKTIIVPWDNDIESMYQSRSLSSLYSDLVGMTSAYVTAFYDSGSRGGVVVGALEHTVWKTGVGFRAKARGLGEGGYGVRDLKAYGGLNGLKETRDYVEHGWVSSKGGEVVSPKFLVAEGDDWRDAMEVYGRAQVEDRMELPGGMKGPVVGWNSWGAQQFPATLQNAVDASEAIRTLKEEGFGGEGGWGGDAFVDFDAVDISLEEQVKLVETTEKNGQSAGFYLAPWSYFSDDLEATVECGGEVWNVVDLVKKNAKGKPLKVLDKRVLGQKNYAYDPTHEAVLCLAMDMIDEAAEAGMKLVKIDFINWGAMEGGSGKNGEHAKAGEGIETGAAAYNYGMERIRERVDGRMIISLSMAPTFPNHFAHARRIGCDQMYGGVEFTMNQLWGGWWQQEMLLLDPDLMVFVKDYIFDIPSILKPLINPWKMDEMSRVNKGVVHGGFYLAGDDLSNSTGVEAVQKWLGNKDVNEVAMLGEAFRPVSSPKDGVHVRAPEVFELESKKTGDKFLAVFNYNFRAMEGFEG